VAGQPRHRARMLHGPEPAGLAFLKKIARLVCAECGFGHEWSRAEDGVHTLTVDFGDKKMTFRFEGNLLEDPGGDQYREIAGKTVDRILRERRPGRPEGKSF